MQWLLTALGFLTLVVNAYLVYRAADYADRADHEGKRLRNMIGRLTALEGSHESLYAQHRKLHGKFHASQRMADEAPREPSHPTNNARGFHEFAEANICDNYRIAQVDGPTSPAAKCECLFCQRSRDIRAARRAEAFDQPSPATVAARRANHEEE